MDKETLQKEVDLKLTVIQETLSSLQSQKLTLQNHAHKVRGEIQETFDKLIRVLRDRERLLLRQVEVATAHQNSLIGLNHAEVMHCQGALTATQKLISSCLTCDSDSLDMIQLDTIAEIPRLHTQKLLSVKIDCDEILPAITNFGHISLPDTITHYTSAVIPAKMEEYDDDEQDLLHKSISTVARFDDTDSSKVIVNFPKLSKASWLVTTNLQNKKKLPSIGQKSTSSLINWLQNLDINNGRSSQESLNDFHLVDNIGSLHSSENSSIEILPNEAEFYADKNDASSCSSKEGSIDKTSWLSKDNKTLESHIEDICLANERCASFKQCIDKGSCRSKALQSALWLGSKLKMAKSLHVSHITNITDSDNSRWLLHKEAKNVGPAHRTKIIYEAPELASFRFKRELHEDTHVRKIYDSFKSVTGEGALRHDVWLIQNSKKQKIDLSPYDLCTEKSDKEKTVITRENLSQALNKVSDSASDDTVWLMDNVKQNVDCVHNNKNWRLFQSSGNAITLGNVSGISSATDSDKNNWIIKAA